MLTLEETAAPSRASPLYTSAWSNTCKQQARASSQQKATLEQRFQARGQDYSTPGYDSLISRLSKRAKTAVPGHCRGLESTRPTGYEQVTRLQWSLYSWSASRTTRHPYGIRHQTSTLAITPGTWGQAYIPGSYVAKVYSDGVLIATGEFYIYW